MSNYKPRICFDFDGVIHSYKSGWQGAGLAPDPPVDGIFDLIKRLHDDGYEIVVCSTRSKSIEGDICVMNYIRDIGLNDYVDRITAEKPSALVYVDDRGICFDGNVEGLYEKIVNFKAWWEE